MQSRHLNCICLPLRYFALHSECTVETSEYYCRGKSVSFPRILTVAPITVRSK